MCLCSYVFSKLIFVCLTSVELCSSFKDVRMYFVFDKHKHNQRPTFVCYYKNFFVFLSLKIFFNVSCP